MLLVEVVCFGWPQDIILSSGCICFNLVGLLGNWVSWLEATNILPVIQLWEHYTDTCYWWLYYCLRLWGPCTLSPSSKSSCQSSNPFNMLSPLVTWWLLDAFSAFYLKSSGSSMAARSLGTFSVIAIELLWLHIGYRTRIRRETLLVLSYYSCYTGIRAPAPVFFDSLRFVWIFLFY